MFEKHSEVTFQENQATHEKFIKVPQVLGFVVVSADRISFVSDYTYRSTPEEDPASKKTIETYLSLASHG